MSDSAKDTIGAHARQATWLKGGGDMGKLVRSKDWSGTSLGPIDSWPDELKTMVSTVLNSRFPMQIWWGEDLIQIYNDAYRPITREKHPDALGAKGIDMWGEVWDVIGPMAEQVMKRGEATWWEDFQFYIKSGGMLEEGYFTFSHSPIYVTEGSEIGGILTTVYETTPKVIYERRLAVLHDLAVRSIGNKSEGEVYRNILNVLSQYGLDLPFALLFRYDQKPKAFRLSGATGLMRYEGPLKDPRKWPLNEAMESGKVLRVDVTPEHFGLVPKDDHGAGVERAIILPLVQSQLGLEVALVLGLSPHRKQNDSRQLFIQALHDQFMTIITSVKSLEHERRQDKVNA